MIWQLYCWVYLLEWLWLISFLCCNFKVTMASSCSFILYIILLTFIWLIATNLKPMVPIRWPGREGWDCWCSQTYFCLSWFNLHMFDSEHFGGKMQSQFFVRALLLLDTTNPLFVSYSAFFEDRIFEFPLRFYFSSIPPHECYQHWCKLVRGFLRYLCLLLEPCLGIVSRRWLVITLLVQDG